MITDDDVKRMKKILKENDGPLTQRFTYRNNWIYIEGTRERFQYVNIMDPNTWGKSEEEE